MYPCPIYPIYRLVEIVIILKKWISAADSRLKCATTILHNKNFWTVALRTTQISKFTSSRGKWSLSKNEQFISAHFDTSFIQIHWQMQEIWSFQCSGFQNGTSDAYWLGLHPLQQPILGVCFFMTAKFKSTACNVTDHGVQ